MFLTPHLFTFSKDDEKLNLTPSSLAGQAICVVRREQCSFRRIKISGNGKKARQAAMFRVRQESDLRENKFLITPDSNGSEASVWGFKTHSQHGGRYIPESMAFAFMKQGVRILKLINGFEGQVWENGCLVASRWWLNAPNIKSWTSFLHSVQNVEGLHSQNMPEVTILPYRSDLPIFKMDKESAATLFSPFKLASVVSLGLICGSLFVAGQYIRNVQTLRTVESDITALSSVTSQISSERRRALSNLRQSQTYNGIGHSGTFLLGLADLSLVLNDKGLLINRISLRSEALEVRLISANDIDVPALVVALEAQPSLENVSIAFGANESVIVTADLLSPYKYQVQFDVPRG